MRATRDIETETSSYLVRWFRDFYNEVAGTKAAIRDGTLVVTHHGRTVGVPVPAGEAAEDIEDDDAEHDDTLDAVLTVRQKLLRVLERQENTAEQIGGEHSFHLYKLAQYVMAALADEVFLNLKNWKGRDLWQDYLLEAKLFQSAAAGDRVFALIDKILHEDDPETVELAKVCMMALALDFQGRYRHRTNRAALARRRNDLYDFIALHDKRLERERPVLVPDAYTATLSGGEAELLPNPRRWIWVFVLVFVTLFMVSWGVWEYTTGALRTELDAIARADDVTDRTRVFDEDTPGVFTIPFEQRWFGPERRLVLGVQARPGMNEDEAAAWLIQSRIATTSRIATISRGGTGVARQRLFAPVPDLKPEAGVVLFELQVADSRDVIVSGERLTIWHPGGPLGPDPPDLLFLYVEDVEN